GIRFLPVTGVQTCALPIWILIHDSFTPSSRNGEDRAMAQQPADRPEPPSPRRAAFGAASTRWREQRAMSKKKLAAAMSFDPSYVSHVEAVLLPATVDYSPKADI